MEQKHRHLILVGFMGTGKSTVGRLLGRNLNRPVTDTDEEVERRTGRKITELFRQEGETGFRDWESRVLADVLQWSPRVIITGGGIVLRRENVERMSKGGWVVALFADEEEIVRRVAGDQNRPLIRGDARRQIARLLEERKHAYDFADRKVDTTGKSPEAVAEEIATAWDRLSHSRDV